MRNTAQKMESAESVESQEEAPISGERARSTEAPDVQIGTWESDAIRNIQGTTSFAVDYATRQGAEDIAVRLQEDEQKALDEIHAQTKRARKGARFMTIPTARIPGLREQPVVMPPAEKSVPMAETAPREIEKPVRQKPASKDTFTAGAVAGASAIGVGVGSSLFGIGRIFSWIHAGLERLEKGNLADTIKGILLIPEKILDWMGEKLGIEAKKEKK